MLREHRSHLRTIFQRLSSYGLKTKYSKCVFGVTELIFLGHLITPVGIKPLPDKVQAVLRLQTTRDCWLSEKIFKTVKFFFRRFLPKAAEQQYLLSEFLKGSKENLASSEKSYSAYDRELLAIYSAIRHFRYMLEARVSQCLLTTSPSLYAFRQTSDKVVLHGRSVSWISSLSSPQILYTFQDLDNIAAMMFSLVFLQSPSQVKLTMTVLLRHNRPDQELPHPNSIWNFLGTPKVPFPNSSTEIMCDLSTAQPDPTYQNSIAKMFSLAMHNLSHPGIRQSVHLMKQRFVWPSISSDVAKWARHCLACQKSKIHRHTRSPLSSFHEPSQRFDHVHLDLIGPLPPSNGYTIA
ncbi:transposon Tf2-6 polyprotein [Trichonephila clavipes]|nr:transposon Tf2-6 polyprotein [Trichonephila clavipes]